MVGSPARARALRNDGEAQQGDSASPRRGRDERDGSINPFAHRLPLCEQRAQGRWLQRFIEHDDIA
jgi:hypothetical protein